MSASAAPPDGAPVIERDGAVVRVRLARPRVLAGAPDHRVELALAGLARDVVTAEHGRRP